MIDAFMLNGAETAFYETLDFLELPSPTGNMLENHARNLIMSL
jgi:hypothetical protein